MTEFGDLTALSSLLQESRESEDSTNRGQAQLPGSASFTNVVSGNTGLNPSNKRDATEKIRNAKDIWDINEVPMLDTIIDSTDSRPTPRYEISYKQEVGTEDTFLGLGDKTPGSQDCSHVIIKIHFPGSTMKDLDLDVIKNRIKAESRTHRLFTYLPVTVDHDNGKAKFDAKKEVLTVTIPIIKEF